MKTSELIGVYLNFAVAKATGMIVQNSDGSVFWGNFSTVTPSTSWQQGGPIIEREEFTLSHSPYDHVLYGRTRPWCAEKKGLMEYGQTPLIAAMRCYVASKLGDEVEIPEELT